MKRKLKTAVIGVGSMGRHHARNYSQMREVELVGVSDTDGTVGQKTAREFKTRFYKNYLEMLETENPHLVSLAAPTRLHHPIALDVIRRKIHLLIEKPITFNIDKAEEVIDEAKRHKIKLTVGHLERFNPAVIALKKLIRQGRLGTIISIMARRAGTIPNRKKDD